MDRLRKSLPAILLLVLLVACGRRDEEGIPTAVPCVPLELARLGATTIGLGVSML